MRYPKLRGAIREKFGTQATFAEAINMNSTTLSKKLTGKSEWTRTEIARACDLIGIPLCDAHTYFFCDRN